LPTLSGPTATKTTLVTVVDGDVSDFDEAVT
jgi:hypothetical protein